jgi:hypothetical protein
LVKNGENEEQKIEDRLLAIEGAIHSVLKALEHYNNTISRMQVYLFLQNNEDPEMMDLYLRLFTNEKRLSTSQPGVNHGKM